MTLNEMFLNIGAALAILKVIPDAYKGLLWIAKRTKTKKDDVLLEKIGKEK